MKYGLIGKKIGYSYSKDIHDLSFNCDYQIMSLNEDEVYSILDKKDFNGLNITIPYKKIVVDKCKYKDNIVKEIGVCNTIANRNGILKAYNTDYYGFLSLLKFYRIDTNLKNVMILGSGSTSSTIFKVLKDQNAKNITIISRSKYPSYKDIKELGKDIDIIINATPYGTFPNNKQRSLVNRNYFKKDIIAIDVIFNPYRSVFLRQFNSHYNGLYMLVAQAIKAESYFANIKCNLKKIKEIYYKILLKKVNIVLIGMPGSGKSSIGSKLATNLSKNFIDTDLLIESNNQLTCKEIINTYGIDYFRKEENKVICSLSNYRGYVISTGGGVILNKNNMHYLKENGIIIYLKRSLNKLDISSSRPLSNNSKKLKELYQNRKNLYIQYSDIIINNNNTMEEVCDLIIKKLNSYR